MSSGHVFINSVNNIAFTIMKTKFIYLIIMKNIFYVTTAFIVNCFRLRCGCIKDLYFQLFSMQV